MQAHELRAPAPRRLTRAEYDRMAELGFFEGERVELIRGVVIAMAPIGTRHRSVVDRLTELLVPPLVGRARVSIQQPFLAVDESEPEPDVSVLPNRRYSDQHPDRAYLLIEVAESSLAFDRETKAPLYAATGVPEYWVVDVAARSVHVHGGLADGRYSRIERRQGDDRLALTEFDDVSFTVDELFE